MSDEIQAVTVVGSRYELALMIALPDNIVLPCARCEHRTMISEQGQNVIAAHPLTARVICLPCAVYENPDAQVVAAPGVLERLGRSADELKGMRIKDFR